MAAAAVDTAYLASFCGVSEPTLETLVTSPSPDTVTYFLQSLITKAQEHESLKSDRVRLDVELENAVRGGESRVKGIKATADKALQEADTLRRKLHEEETARSRLQDELQTLKLSSSTSSEEFDGLRTQVTRLESSNRETLSLLDSKSTAHDKLAENLATQHQKTVELRREISSYQERLQNADNDSSSAKFRESSLQQEVELLKRNNDWLNSELQTKSGDYSKYRKDKSAKIAELQRTNEDVETNLSSARRTETSLRQRLDEIGQKLDDAFLKIQHLTDEAAKTEESFRAELDNARRLADLQGQSADTAKRRVQELDEVVEQIKADASEELGQAQAELETERTTREAAEQRVEALELQVERLESDVANAAAVSRPQTPATGRHSRGPFATPARAGSPAFSVGGASQSRGGTTYTQLYSDYNNTKAALEEEKRRSAKFSATIEEMIDDLDKRAPEIQELRMENARMEADVSNMSKALEDLQQQKDSLRKETRKSEGEAAGLRRQEQILRQQLRDRDAQLKFLAVSVNLYEEGVRVNELQREQLEEMARGNFSDQAYEGLSATDRYLSQHLVVFRNIAELVDKNAQLLNLTRQLGDRMEGEEAQANRQDQERMQAEVATLREQKERSKDQIQSLITQSNSFVRERDMFRRMLAHRKQIPQDADLESMFGESANGNGLPQTPRGGSVVMNGDSPAAKDHADQTKLIKDLQLHIDAYKQEAATDLGTLKSQIDKLAREKGELQSEMARVKSQLTLAHERFEMLQSNFSLARSENEEMQKRSRKLEDAAAKEDIRLHQTSEDLIQAREGQDALRGENANLKAEKDLWKRIETRLNEDNSNLTQERGRLNKIISDAQSLSNQRELSDSENRRRLQGQIESLDSELRIARRKLEQEVEEGKKSSLRREYEQEQSRARIDETMQSLNNTKEEMVAIKTTRDQLQARVDELKIDLKNAQDHALALQPRPTPRAAAVLSEVEAQPADESLNREQELGIEIADLRRELDLTKGDLENANVQIQQYRDISQASEESLNNLQETHEQYIEDMDKVSAEKDSKVTELEQRVKDILAEATITNTQLSELRASANDSDSRLSEQKSTYDVEVARLKDESERHQEAAKAQQEYVKAQAEIALSAQQNYDNELQRHAEAAKALQQVRSEYNLVKLEVSSAKASAEAAQSTITRNEESWASIRDQYERELLDLKRRREDVENQNKLLHQHLESVSTQISGLQEKQVAGSSTAEIEASTDTGLQNLQEVIKYLRREKEIVDVQYELSVQESRRLKQQLDYSQSQLDDSRLKLDQERQRQADKDRNSTSHSQMVETLNQINVYRESNASLREDARRARSQLEDKAKKVDELLEQIQPLQASLRELENNFETGQGEIRLLQEDRDRWQKRTQDILQKYDRVDPAELEGLKNKLQALEQERDSTQSSKTSIQEELATTKSELESLQSSIEPQIQKARDDFKEKIQEQYKARSRELSTKIKGLESDVSAARQELTGVKADLDDTRKARDNAIARADAAGVAPAPGFEAQPHPSAQQDRDTTMEDGEEGEIDESNIPDGKVTINGAAPETELNSAIPKDDEMQAVVNGLEEQIRGLRARVSELESEVQTNQTELASIRNEQVTSAVQPTAPTANDSEHLQKLQADLEAAQAELATLQQQSDRPQGAEVTLNNSTKADPVDSMTAIALAKAELEKAFEEKVQKTDEDFNTRTEKMREQLNQKLREGRQKAKDDVQADHEASLQALRQEHATAISQLEASHLQELSKVREDHEEQLKTVREPTTTDGTGAATADQKASIDAAASDTAPAASAPTGPWMQSQEEVKKFINTNAIVREILQRNIRTKVDQEKENSTKAIQQLQETHTARLTELEQVSTTKIEEIQQKATKNKEQAVEMESKKWKVKINMSETKLKLAQAKIEIFEKAATDTPQKPVIEIWLIVKDFKLKPGQPIQTQGAVPSQGQNAPKTPSTTQSPRAIASSQQPQSPSVPATPVSGSVQQSGQAEVQPEAEPDSTQPPPQRHQRRLSQAPYRPPSRQRTSSMSRGNSTTPNNHNLSSKPPSSQTGAGQHGAGTGPAALRSLTQGSGLPRAASSNAGASIRGAANRGGATSSNSRGMLPDRPLTSEPEPGRGGYGQTGMGRGSGQPNRGGRGGGQGQGQHMGRGGNMDPDAAQFVPQDQYGGGYKRPRRDSSGSERFGSGGKRPRGSGRGGRGY